MKYAFLPALLLLAFTAQAQFDQPQPLSHPLPGNLREEICTPRLKSRNNTELRLDSVVYFKNYTLQDSVKYQFAIYDYAGDSLLKATSKKLDDLTGSFENYLQYFMGYDDAGRNDFFQYSLPENGVFKPQFSEKIYFRNATGDEKDSIHNFQYSSVNGQPRIATRFLNYEYDAQKNETLHDEYQLDLSGIPDQVYRFASTYNTSNRLDTIFYFSGFTPLALGLDEIKVYKYSGDTVFYDILKKIWPNNWETRLKSITLNSLSGKPLFENSIYLDVLSQTWKTNLNREYTYDAEDRLKTLKVTGFDINGNMIISYYEYEYVQEDLLSALFSYNIDNSTGILQLLNKRYFYYTDVPSATTHQFPELNITIAPNPANDVITIQTSNAVIDRVEINNLAGQPVKNISIPGNTVVKIERAGLSAGIYLVKVITGKGITVQEVIFK